jgi:hypothetical protein
MNLQPSKDKDRAYDHAKIYEFDHKHHELKENLEKPNALKEYEDFDLRCIETSFHQQRTDLKRKSSNKKSHDVIASQPSNTSILVAGIGLSQPTDGLLQRKRSNIDVDIRPCEPNERY